MSSRVLVYHTGGTIGMVKENGKLVPDRTGFERRLRKALKGEDLPAWDYEQEDPPIDSAKMCPSDWMKIARKVAKAALDASYRAIVVLHGTDTMAYTTSALAFMLEGLSKPVIFTGSQVPLDMPNSDAANNVAGALLLSADVHTPRVVSLYFHGKLLLGCRAVKVSASSHDAFESPNFPALATLSKQRVSHSKHFALELAKSPGELTSMEALRSVGVFRIFPGVSYTVARRFLCGGLRGAILQAYGAGNGPDEVKKAIEAAYNKNVVLAVCTQCVHGSASPEDYESGFGQLVADCRDTTTEAALAKLVWLLGRSSDPAEVRSQMSRNLRGEMSDGPPQAKPSRHLTPRIRTGR